MISFNNNIYCIFSLFLGLDSPHATVVTGELVDNPSRNTLLLFVSCTIVQDVPCCNFDANQLRQTPE